jgi:spermidine synthase
MSRRAEQASTRSIALELTALTGFAGLVYEITWQKDLGVLLGSDSEATATLLGVLLGGLSLGDEGGEPAAG